MSSFIASLSSIIIGTTGFFRTTTIFSPKSDFVFKLYLSVLLFHADKYWDSFYHNCLKHLHSLLWLLSLLIQMNCINWYLKPNPALGNWITLLLTYSGKCNPVSGSPPSWLYHQFLAIDWISPFRIYKVAVIFLILKQSPTLVDTVVCTSSGPHQPLKACCALVFSSLHQEMGHPVGFVISKLAKFTHQSCLLPRETVVRYLSAYHFLDVTICSKYNPISLLPLHQNT